MGSWGSRRYINYIFSGSQESLIRDIFEKKKSPFYHFGLVMPLTKIPEKEFTEYLNQGFKSVSRDYAKIAGEILAVTHCHPHFTQQLAYIAWERSKKGEPGESVVEDSVTELIHSHELDYERIWARFNNMDKKMLIALAQTFGAVLSEEYLRKNELGASSTAYSSIKRLSGSGNVNKDKNQYTLDDPFFRLWIRRKRED